MNCTESTNNLTAYLDQQLSGTEIKDLESHLGSCPKCGEELESLRQSSAFLDSKVRELELNPALWNAVRVRISSTPASTTASSFWAFLAIPRWAAFAAATAAVLVLVGLGVSEYLKHEETRQALSKYMQQYVQEREAQEQLHQSVSMNPSENAKYPDNPFVTSAEETQYGNPFLEQGQ
jgi:hypothetical protein